MAEKILKRFLQKSGLTKDQPPATQEHWSQFLGLIAAEFAELKDRREIYENALTVSTGEMERLYQALESKSKAESEEHQRLLTSVIDALPVALTCKDANDDLRYILWNRKAEDIFGRTSQAVLGKNDTEIFPQDLAAAFLANDCKTCQSTEIVITEEEVAATSMNPIPIRSHRTAARDLNGTPQYVLVVSEDISLERNTKERLISSAKLASLGEMAGNIAHEVNNPTSIIHGHANMILWLSEHQPENLPRIKEIATTIIQTSDRIAKIVKGLKSFAREDENDPMQVQSVQEIITGAFDLCAERIRNHGVRLDLDIPIALAMVECRPVQIEQVLVNLLSNAFDAIATLTEKWITLAVHDRDSSIEIVVTDAGLGIPIAVRNRMMQPFYTTKAVGKGTGLGLSIARSIVESHRGALTYDESCPNTRFIVTLPKHNPRVPAQEEVVHAA